MRAWKNWKSIVFQEKLKTEVRSINKWSKIICFNSSTDKWRTQIAPSDTEKLIAVGNKASIRYISIL